MKCFGVVAEFNPFHDGHSYLISKAKEMTGCRCCIAAMSGDFTQRGEPAVFDKWERAKKAVEQGADLVVEIPQVYACSSAQYFAYGAVSVLAGLGVCDHLAFGSESGDTDAIIRTAECLDEHESEINAAAGELLKQGISYPKAREQALKELSEGSSIASPGPNDILAVEYLRQLPDDITPTAIKRTGAGHNETASEIRSVLRNKYPDRFNKMDTKYFDLLTYRIAMTPADELESYAESENGLGSKLKKEFRYASCLDDLIDRVKSKAYTRTAITRLLTHMLLGIRRADLTGSTYARVLAMNDIGAEALRIIRKEELSLIPVISNLTKDMEKLNESQKRMISFDITAGDVYNIITEDDLYKSSDYVRSPFKA